MEERYGAMRRTGTETWNGGSGRGGKPSQVPLPQKRKVKCKDDDKWQQFHTIQILFK
jgi:hypothetical protein